MRKVAKQESFDSPGNAQVSTQKLSKKYKRKLKAAVDWVVLSLLIFVAIFLNYFYTTSLQDLIAISANKFVYLMDLVGCDVHFIRFVHLTLFDKSSITDNEGGLTELGQKIGYDGLMLCTIILPLFFSAMHFYCAPFKKRYTGKIQCLISPLALIPCFYW